MPGGWGGYGSTRRPRRVSGEMQTRRIPGGGLAGSGVLRRQVNMGGQLGTAGPPQMPGLRQMMFNSPGEGFSPPPPTAPGLNRVRGLTNAAGRPYDQDIMTMQELAQAGPMRRMGPGGGGLIPADSTIPGNQAMGPMRGRGSLPQLAREEALAGMQFGGPDYFAAAQMPDVVPGGLRQQMGAMGARQQVADIEQQVRQREARNLAAMQAASDELGPQMRDFQNLPFLPGSQLPADFQVPALTGEGQFERLTSRGAPIQPGMSLSEMVLNRGGGRRMSSRPVFDVPHDLPEAPPAGQIGPRDTDTAYISGEGQQTFGDLRRRGRQAGGEAGARLNAMLEARGAFGPRTDTETYRRLGANRATAEEAARILGGAAPPEGQESVVDSLRTAAAGGDPRAAAALRRAGRINQQNQARTERTQIAREEARLRRGRINQRRQQPSFRDMVIAGMARRDPRAAALAIGAVQPQPAAAEQPGLAPAEIGLLEAQADALRQQTGLAGSPLGQLGALIGQGLVDPELLREFWGQLQGPNPESEPETEDRTWQEWLHGLQVPPSGRRPAVPRRRQRRPDMNIPAEQVYATPIM